MYSSENSRVTTIALNAIKAVISTTFVYFIAAVCVVGFKEITALREDKILSIFEYLWMQPIDLQSYLNGILEITESTIAEYFFFKVFLFGSALLFAVGMISTIVYKLSKVLVSVLKAKDISTLFKSVSSVVSWLIAWFILNAINAKFGLESFWVGQVLKDSTSELMTTLMTLAFVCSLLYSVKSVVLSVLIQTGKTFGMMKRKAYGE